MTVSDLPAAGSNAAPLLDATSPWSPGFRWLTAGLLLTVAAWGFESLAVATVLPLAADDLGGLGLYGWAFGAFLLANLVVAAVAGGEVDRFGPPVPYALGIGVFVLGLAVAGAAPSMTAFIVGRAIQGVGGGILSAAAYAVVGRAYPEAIRPRMLALMASAWVVPALTGPPLAGLAAEIAGWRWAFLGLIPIPLVAFLLTAPTIGKIGPGIAPPPASARVLQASLLATGVAILMAGLGRREPAVALAIVAAGIALCVAPLRRLLPPGTFRAAPGLPAAVATMALLSAGFYGVEAFLPLALTNLRGQSSVVAGLPLIAAALAWPAGAWLLGNGRVRGGRRAAALGLAMIAAGTAGAGIGLLSGRAGAVVPAAWFVAGVGVSLAYAAAQLAAFGSAGPGREGSATAALQLVHVLAITFATGVGGVLVSGAGSAGQPSVSGFMLHGALMLACILVGFGAARRMPDDDDQ